MDVLVQLLQSGESSSSEANGAILIRQRRPFYYRQMNRGRLSS